MTLFWELLMISFVVTVTTAISGVYLVLKGRSLTTFGLSHSTLIGIVVMFVITNNLNSPWLIFGATLTGLLIVWLVEILDKSPYIKIDASLGLVYLFFFALGVFAVARFAASTTLSTRSVVTGNIALVPFDRVDVNGQDLGPTFVWILMVIFLVNVVFLLLFYKELRIVTFDPEYAKIYGINPDIVNYLYMTTVSLTIVTVFQVTGIILVVSLMVLPAASAYLLTKSLWKMIYLSIVIGGLNAVIGMPIAWELGKVEIASMIGVTGSVIFMLVYLFSLIQHPWSRGVELSEMEVIQ